MTPSIVTGASGMVQVMWWGMCRPGTYHFNFLSRNKIFDIEHALSRVTLTHSGAID